MKIVHVRRFFLTAVVVFGALTPLVPVDTTEAVSGTCYFSTTAGPVKGTSGCKESGLGAYGTNDVLTGRTPTNNGLSYRGSAIPAYINTKSEFINFIVKRFNNGGTHDRIGAAFIMQQMRGSRAWPSSAARDDWVSRMKDSNVTVKSQWDSSVGRTSWYDDDKRNTFYANHPNVGRQVINVRQDGRLIAQIEHLCGNMVAGAIELKDPWDVDPATSVSPSSGKIIEGQTITWKHTITNRGPASMSRGGTYKINGATATNTTGTYARHSKGWVGTLTRSYVTKPSDVGKEYCQSLTISPNSSSNSSSETSAKKCVRVIGNYELTPEAELDANVVEAGSQVNVTGTVQNAGRTSSSTKWQVTKTVVTPGGSIATDTKDTTADPCAWFKNDCTVEKSGTRTFAGTVLVASLANQTIPDLPVGTRICWAVSVKPPTATAGSQWRHSAPVCATIGKKPKIQIRGGDARIRGDVMTSNTTINIAETGGNKTYGSWTEFGAMSTGENRGMASGAGLRNGNTSNDQSGWSELTFANVAPNDTEADTAYPYGRYGSLPGAAEIAEYFSAKASTPVGSSVSLNGRGSGIYRASGNVVISGSTNRSIIVISDGTVTINGGGISYSNMSYTSLADIPQVIVIAKDIKIAGSVDTVNAWLIASDSINTCADVADVTNPKLTANTCNKPLVINGPVATSELYLFRTAGSGTGENVRDPAEIINLTPETYLWSYNYALQRSHPTTTSVIELPPRY